jgi:hypothetical protein
MSQRHTLIYDDYNVHIYTRDVVADSGVVTEKTIAMTGLSLKNEFDKYPFGISNNQCEISFNINIITSGLLSKLLDYTVVDYGYSFDYVVGAGTAKQISYFNNAGRSFDMVLSNVIVIEKNSTIYFMGCQNDVKLQGSDIVCNFQHITRFILENLPFEFLNDMIYSVDNKETAEVYHYYYNSGEYYIKDLSIDNSVSPSVVNKFIMIKRNAMILYISNLISIYLSKLLKEDFDVADYTFSFTETAVKTFYSQNTTTGLLGTALTSDKIFYNAFECENDNTIIDSMFNQLAYKNIYEYLKDVCEQYENIFDFRGNISFVSQELSISIRLLPLLFSDISNFGTKTLKPAHCFNYEVMPSALANRLRISRSVNVNKFEKNIDTFEYTNNAYEGNVTYVTNCVDNINIPNGKYLRQLKKAFNLVMSEHLLNTLCYYDITEDIYIKVYEHCLYQLSSSLDSQDFVAFNEYPNKITLLHNILNITQSSYNKFLEGLQTLLTYLQRSNGIAYISASLLYALFGSPTVSGIEFDYLAKSDGFDVFNGGTCPLRFTIDLTKLFDNTSLSSLNNNFSLVTFEYDVLEDSIIKIEGVGRG